MDERTRNFAEFLDNLYRDYHENLDRLGFTGTAKLAEVILAKSEKVIEELNKYQSTFNVKNSL